MFCPKCGQQNPETGKFCRGCGNNLGNVSSALSSPQPTRPLVNHKDKPIHLEGAITKFCTGLAFLIISIVLAFSHMGRGWWFWMLIPAFTSLGAGVAQYIQLKKAEQAGGEYSRASSVNAFPHEHNTALPPPQTEWVANESRYKTGDLAPPSVTDGTTRNLEIDTEAKTMTLPTK